MASGPKRQGYRTCEQELGGAVPPKARRRPELEKPLSEGQDMNSESERPGFKPSTYPSAGTSLTYIFGE